VRSAGLVLGYLQLTRRSTDDTMKGSTSLTDALLDPTTSHSEEPSDSPCLRILKTKSYFDYLYAPGNEYQSVRFQVTMDHGASSDNSTVISGGFPWESLPEGTKIVDVGGGVGSACQEIMKKNPLLKFTVQDLPSVIEQANAVSSSTSMSPFERISVLTVRTQYWNQYEPKAIEDGRVTIQAHDFFTPQPVKDADIFLLRCILHDWSNSKAIEILKWLREAAIPGKTRVVVMDSIIQHTCAVDWKQIGREAGIAFEGLDGRSEVPAGLLSNLGRAEAKKYLIDLMYGLPLIRFRDCDFSDIRLQDAGNVQRARAYDCGPHSCDGSERVENQEDILPRRKENQSYTRRGGLSRGKGLKQKFLGGS